MRNQRQFPVNDGALRERVRHLLTAPQPLEVLDRQPHRASQCGGGRGSSARDSSHHAGAARHDGSLWCGRRGRSRRGRCRNCGSISSKRGHSPDEERAFTDELLDLCRRRHLAEAVDVGWVDSRWGRALRP
eukprot:8904622-Pyramimonas_sp.AAC.1